MKVITVFPSFANKGGAEDMALSLAKGLNKEPVVMHNSKEIAETYLKSNARFEKFNIKNIYKFHRQGCIFLSHHRKTTTFLRLASIFLFGNKLRIIHVAHTTFSSLKNITLFPKNNIAVSNTVKDNMVSYFDIKEDRIKVIYNGLKDDYNPKQEKHRYDDKTIKILFLGRIDPVKRQIEFVKHTKNKLDSNLKIYFGGEGKDFEKLKEEIGNNSQYIMLGLIDIFTELYKYDYICLFSQKEGLPLSLIQGQMYHKPLVTNNIPQCLEINENEYCGFVTHSWDDVVTTLNNLPQPNSEEYQRLSCNSRLVFEQKFDYTTMIKNYESYIESISWKQ